MIMDIVSLHMGINDVINSEASKDLVSDSITNIARECVAFGVKKCIYLKLDDEDGSELVFTDQSDKRQTSLDEITEAKIDLKKIKLL